MRRTKLTSRTLPNGVVSTYEYDPLNRLTCLKHAEGVNTLADFQYQFDTASNITQMTDGSGAHNYTYDSPDRLTAGSHPGDVLTGNWARTSPTTCGLGGQYIYLCGKFVT